MRDSHWKPNVLRLFQPMRWSIGARRAFLLLLPLAIPAWITAVLMAAALAIAVDFGQVLRRFWAAPPKRRVSSYGYYRYGR